MTPRIYTYKVTFEETLDWYWGSHKEKVLGEIYFGSPVTHKWKWDFYTPVFQILEIFEYSEEGWKSAQEVEKRLIKPDLGNPLCLNENCGGMISFQVSRESGIKGAGVCKKKGIGFFSSETQSVLGRRGGLRSAELKVGAHHPDNLGKGIQKMTDEQRSKGGITCVEKRVGIFSLDDEQKLAVCSSGGSNGCVITNNLKYIDPDHPELGAHNPGVLSQMQRRRGLPHGKDNRVKVTG
jgi:hypothetical protein